MCQIINHFFKVAVLIEDLTTVQSSVNALFSPALAATAASAGGGGPKLERAASSLKGPSYGASKDEMRALFSDRIKIYTAPADFSSGAVLFCVLKVVVKGFVCFQCFVFPSR